jgi:hypothetical protein
MAPNFTHIRAGLVANHCPAAIRAAWRAITLAVIQTIRKAIRQVVRPFTGQFKYLNNYKFDLWSAKSCEIPYQYQYGHEPPGPSHEIRVCSTNSHSRDVIQGGWFLATPLDTPCRRPLFPKPPKHKHGPASEKAVDGGLGHEPVEDGLRQGVVELGEDPVRLVVAVFQEVQSLLVLLQLHPLRLDVAAELERVEAIPEGKTWL